MAVNHHIEVEQATRALAEGSGRGIRVAIVDTGIERIHPALRNCSLADDLEFAENGFSVRKIPGVGRDTYGHGTAIAGIIHTLAPEATLASFKAFKSKLTSKSRAIEAAVREAIRLDYHIIHCSFGSGLRERIFNYKAWVDEAYLKGRHVVAACSNLSPEFEEWPGHFTSVITVNSNPALQPHRFIFNPGSMVEFEAKGENVKVAWKNSEYRYVTGSSYASPVVTGYLARLISQYPRTSPLLAKHYLQVFGE